MSLNHYEQTKVEVRRLTSELPTPTAVHIINDLSLASDNEEAIVLPDAGIKVPVEGGMMTYNYQTDRGSSQTQVVRLFAGGYILPKTVLGIFNTYRRRVDFFGRNYTESIDPTTGRKRIVLEPGVTTENPTVDKQIFHLRVLGDLYLPEGSVEIDEEAHQLPTATKDTELLVTSFNRGDTTKLPPMLDLLARTVTVT